MRIEQVMTRAVATCHPFDRLIDAAARMDREDLGCLAVVASDGTDRLVGLLTDRDVSIAAARDEGELPELQVRGAMRGSHARCAPGDPVASALDLMRESRVRRLPVANAEGRLVGLISLADIARAAAWGEESASRDSCREVCRALAQGSRGGRRGEA